jgi:galactonate dehydratase
VSAIDQALWDIAARREGISLAVALSRETGGAVGTTVPLYANVNRGTLSRTPEGFAASANAAASAGFTGVKIAPFDGMAPALVGTPEGKGATQAGIDCIAAAHAALAGRARMMVDCHWRFSPAAAEEVLRELARIGVAWYECPVPEISDNLPAVRRLRGLANAAGMQLAGMEEASLTEGFLPWADAYDVLMPDVKYTGGMAETLRIAEGLRARGTGVSLHNPTGSVCHAVSLHVSAALSTGLPLEIQWGETDLLFDLPVPELPRPLAGGSALPNGPGHGASLSLERDCLKLA